jgi:hypothetical protein
VMLELVLEPDEADLVLCALERAREVAAAPPAGEAAPPREPAVENEQTVEGTSAAMPSSGLCGVAEGGSLFFRQKEDGVLRIVTAPRGRL